jgi:hypothetical protein
LEDEEEEEGPSKSRMAESERWDCRYDLLDSPPEKLPNANEPLWLRPFSPTEEEGEEEEEEETTNDAEDEGPAGETEEDEEDEGPAGEEE